MHHNTFQHISTVNYYCFVNMHHIIISVDVAFLRDLVEYHTCIPHPGVYTAGTGKLLNFWYIIYTRICRIANKTWVLLGLREFNHSKKIVLIKLKLVNRSSFIVSCRSHLHPYRIHLKMVENTMVFSNDYIMGTV